MTNTVAIDIIKNTVQSLLPGAKILLFGSMARGDFNSNSDFDILIITKNEFGEKEKISRTGEIRKNLIKLLRAPFDVLMNSEQEVAYKKELPGHIVRWALKEGVML